MNLLIKKNAKAYLSLLSFFINYFPYIIFILLINRQGSIVSNVLPMAIFYAFRRTALFIFRDFRKNSQLLGWIGIFFALFGYLIGIFGVISDMVFDIAAVFAGSASAIFPNALRQNKRQDPAKSKKKANGKQAGILLILLLLSMILFALIAKFIPTISFLILFLLALIGVFAYYHVYGYPEVTEKVKFNSRNLILVGVLLIAMFLMEKGRNQNVGNMVVWGVGLLVVFLIVLLLLLIFDREDHFAAAGKETYFQISMYGACAMFWITYSAILVTVTHGVAAFYWIFLAYLAAIILAKPILNFTYKIFPGKPLTVNSTFIIIGILCTFWFPTYFIGIVLIRVFASYQKQIALNQYEQETGNQQDSYLLSYYLTSLSAFWTQAIMWLSLLIYCHEIGFEEILHDITFHEIARNYLWGINLTHFVLAIAMIAFVVMTYLVSIKKEVKKVEK